MHFGVVAFPPSLPAPPPFSPGKGWHRSDTPPTVFLSSLPIRDFYTAVFKSSTRLWLSVPGAQEGSSRCGMFSLCRAPLEPGALWLQVEEGVQQCPQPH